MIKQKKYVRARRKKLFGDNHSNDEIQSKNSHGYETYESKAQEIVWI